eukprot:symbB.v1.2.003175.t1/scaffold173.1/size339812/18
MLVALDQLSLRCGPAANVTRAQMPEDMMADLFRKYEHRSQHEGSNWPGGFLTTSSTHPSEESQQSRRTEIPAELDAWILGPSLSGSCGLSVKEASRHPWTLGMAVLALEGHKKLEAAQQELFDAFSACFKTVNGRTVETWQPHETIMLCNDTTFFDLADALRSEIAMLTGETLAPVTDVASIAALAQARELHLEGELNTENLAETVFRTQLLGELLVDLQACRLMSKKYCCTDLRLELSDKATSEAKDLVEEIAKPFGIIAYAARRGGKGAYKGKSSGVQQPTDEKALQLWASVVEFQHMPPTTALDATATGMPPLRQAACVNQPCARCEEKRGGFQFPWIGPWTSKGVLVVPGATVEGAWRRREELQDKLDLLELRMLSDDKTATDFCPALWYKAVQLAAPLLGCASKQQVFEIWRQWQRGYAVWRDPLHVGPEVDPEREMARQAMVTCLEAAQDNPTTHLAKPCFHCKTPCRRVPSMECFQHCRWANVMRMLSGTWSASANNECGALRLVAGALLAGWVLGFRRDRSLHCAGDGVPEADASTALALVAEQRVREWRRQHHMEDDADFAFAFENFEAAQHAGGHHLACAWVEARAAQHELLLPDAAAVMEATARRPQPSSAPVARAPVRSWTMSRRRGIRLHPNVADTPEAISNRAEALGRVFKQCGALQPLGYISEQLDREWTQACARLGQRLVTASEAVTVSNAIRTASELESFMRSRGRPYPPQHVDLDAFLHDPGCLRQKHIARSQPRKLTKSTLHCECSRGKQKKLRKGFSYCIPSHFSTGWPWAQHMIQRYDKLSDAKKKRCGLCFDEAGTPWHMREITLIAREIFVGQVEHPQTLTSYSWRRWAPSMGQVLGFDPLQLASLSDWQDKTSVPENASMPLHYSGARWTGSFTKTADSMLWAMPMSAAEVRSRFQLTTALRRRAAEMRKQSEAAHVVKTMPASINGRTMSSFMKNGDPLCAAYQQGLCGRDEEVCLGKHRCAAVLKSSTSIGSARPVELHEMDQVAIATRPAHGWSTSSLTRLLWPRARHESVGCRLDRSLAAPPQCSPSFCQASLQDKVVHYHGLNMFAGLRPVQANYADSHFFEAALHASPRMLGSCKEPQQPKATKPSWMLWQKAWQQALHLHRQLHHQLTNGMTSNVLELKQLQANVSEVAVTQRVSTLIARR